MFEEHLKSVSKTQAASKKKATALLVIFLLAASLNVWASKIQVRDPVEKELYGPEPEILDLGVVGPGQKIEILASRNSGEASKLRPPNEAVWDKLVVVGETLPLGWKGVDSLLYEDPMRAFVILDKNASDGEYVFETKALNTYEDVPPLVFKAKVRVSRNVLDASVSKTTVKSGVGQPAIYSFVLTNKGSASDVFEISAASGLPGTWRYVKEVFVPHNSKVLTRYEVVSEEQGEFQITFKVKSLSSPAISVEQKTLLVAESSLFEDAKSSSHGILLFPSIVQVIYSLLGLIANLVQIL